MRNKIRIAPAILLDKGNRATGHSCTAVPRENGTEEPFRLGNRLFWLDGAGIISGIAILESSELSLVIPNRFSVAPFDEIAAWWGKNAKNPCALYVLDEFSDEALCLQDPLGGAIVFYASFDTKSFISTDINRLREIASKNDLSLTKSLEFQIERLLLGNGGITPSSFNEVNKLNPFEYIQIKNGLFEIKRYDLDKYYDDLDYVSLTKIVAEDITAAVSAISQSSSIQKISHLTGGFDSRLVLGASIASGAAADFLFFCSGPEGTTDRIVADGITRYYGLRRSNGAGLTASPSLSMPERLMAPLFHSGGLTSTGPLGREQAVSVSAAGGGYGEVYRTFFGNRLSEYGAKVPSEAELLSKFVPMGMDGHPYISVSSINSLSKRLHQNFEYLSGIYSEKDFLGDAFYTHTRNRYHIGQSSLLWSRVGSRFDPLYSVAGYYLAKSVPQSARNANVIGFDLMGTFDPSLLQLPFDYDRFNADLLSSRRRPAPRSFETSDSAIIHESSISPNNSADSRFLSVLGDIDIKEPEFSASDRRNGVARANKLGVNFWQILHLESGKKILESSVDKVNDSDIFDFIDKKYVTSLIESKEPTKRELRDIYSLSGILSWYAFG